MRGAAIALTAAAIAVPLPPGKATAQEEQRPLHAVFEERCGRCHERSGALARERLVIKDGRLLSRENGGHVLEFLLGHYGRLSRAQAQAFYENFLRQVRGAGRFKRQCAICHVRASELARDLVIEDGRLFGRYSGQKIGEFLLGHARLETEEADFFYRTLLSVKRIRE